MSSRVSPSQRLHAEIDQIFAGGGDLATAIEQVARLGAQLLLQTALEAEVTPQRPAKSEDLGSPRARCPATETRRTVMAYIKPPVLDHGGWPIRWPCGWACAASPPSPWLAAAPASPTRFRSFLSRLAVAATWLRPHGESEWVRNLRAAGKGELSRRGQAEVFQAVEVPAGDRAAIIARYRQVAGRTVSPYFTKLPKAEDHPVFRIG